MIREQDLQEAIAECQGEKNPNANTCIKLAAYYTILNHMTGGYSFASEPAGQVSYDSGSEFSEAIRGMDTNDILRVIDELMDTLQVLMPRLYFATLDKIKM